MAKPKLAPMSLLEQKLEAALKTCRACNPGISYLEDLAAVSPELMQVVAPVRVKHSNLDQLARVGLAAKQADEEAG
jgi:hypothetical protein